MAAALDGRDPGLGVGSQGSCSELCPLSCQRSSPDVKAELFELLFRVLHHNWRYFFKSSVLASVQRGVAEEQMENEAQFSAIMQVTHPFPAFPRTCPAGGHSLLGGHKTWNHRIIKVGKAP